MTLKHIVPENTKTMGTYSPAVKANGFLFVSGQLGIAPGQSEVTTDDPAAEVRQCFENIKAICESAGTTLDHAVKINVYYTDVAASDQVNAVMAEYFKAPYPARVRYQIAGLVCNAKVEIDGIFVCDE